MNRDFFVEKVLRGESVALADVVKSNAESELAAIHREAESRAPPKPPDLTGKYVEKRL